MLDNTLTARTQNKEIVMMMILMAKDKKIW